MQIPNKCKAVPLLFELAEYYTKIADLFDNIAIRLNLIKNKSGETDILIDKANKYRNMAINNYLTIINVIDIPYDTSKINYELGLLYLMSNNCPNAIFHLKSAIKSVKHTELKKEIEWILNVSQGDFCRQKYIKAKKQREYDNIGKPVYIEKHDKSADKDSNTVLEK